MNYMFAGKIIKYISFVILISIVHNAQAQLYFFNQQDTTNADAIIVSEEVVAEIKNNSCVYHIHKIVTLLNNRKTELGEFNESYNKNSSVKFIKGNITDKYGNIKKIKKSDLKDVANLSEFASDSRIVYYDLILGATQFPITIEYEYELTDNFVLYIPTWYPVPDYDVTTKHSSYTIQSSSENDFRFLEKNNAPSFTKSFRDNKHVYTWVLNDFKAVKEEESSPMMDDVLPSVMFAPTNLVYNEYNNRFDDWRDFGSWIKKLNSDRKIISEDLKQKVTSITKDKPNNTEKAKVLYEYMQSITRYISIQFGIGGFQPISTEKVYNNGYGDCKALSNFMVTLLNTANIPAYYTLVKAGANKNIKSEFPSTQFNHVIVCCVPNEKDTIWLECTSQKIAFGYLSDFTDDRDVLVIADKSFISHTKSYSAEESKTVTTGSININSNGDASCQLLVKNFGLNTEDLSGIYDYNSKQLQKQKLPNYFSFKNIEIEDFTFTSVKNIIPELTLDIKIESREYASKSGSRLFIPVNQTFPFLFDLTVDTVRKQPFVQIENYTMIDSIKFNFPVDYKVDSKNTNGVINTTFGSYEYHLLFENNTAFYYRKLILNKGKFPANQYQELYQFYKDIATKDAIKMVLKKML